LEVFSLEFELFQLVYCLVVSGLKLICWKLIQLVAHHSLEEVLPEIFLEVLSLDKGHKPDAVVFLYDFIQFDSNQLHQKVRIRSRLP
jgi:hypothetical protein